MSRVAMWPLRRMTRTINANAECSMSRGRHSNHARDELLNLDRLATGLALVRPSVRLIYPSKTVCVCVCARVCIALLAIGILLRSAAMIGLFFQMGGPHFGLEQALRAQSAQPRRRRAPVPYNWLKRRTENELKTC